MGDKFEIGSMVICVKEHETLKVGSHYKILGSGDLSMNAATDKKSFGFCIEDDQYGSFSGRKDWWNLPYSEKIKWYYFTEQEMLEYFITEEDGRKAYQRNEKLNKLGI